MVSDALRKYAKEQYHRRRPLLLGYREGIEKGMDACTEEERVLMEFLYGTMPLGDVGEYDFSVFLGFVRHARMLRETMAWCRGLPEDIFLHHVLYYRINNERIEDCRRFFYDQIAGRIQGMTMGEAALEVNYWCGENGTYELTDDRTASPMTVYRAGRGRCGEESVFAVTALRSVGIPARQVYTPRWAHCDDNHAWVEVYVEGGWHFLGACEPEEVLDRGWFIHASSRALLVHTQTFSDYQVSHGEELLGREAGRFTYNRTAAYARTRRFGIRVLDVQGLPVCGARVSVEILNMAEYYPVAVLCTDREGRAEITLGLGDIHITARKDGQWGEEAASVRSMEEAVVVLGKEDPGVSRDSEGMGKLASFRGWLDMDVEAPADGAIHRPALSRDQKEKNRRRLKECRRIREHRITSYFCEEQAAAYPEERGMLLASGGNAPELYDFLSRDENPDRRALLSGLSRKDYRDAGAEVLESHVQGAACFRSLWEARGQLEIYERYILCPRIGLEELSSFREVIQDYFSKEEKERFRENPEEIWHFIESNIRYDEREDCAGTLATPGGCLGLLWGNPLSQNILFVGICRTLGIPARLNPVNQEGEWMKDGQFIPHIQRQMKPVRKESERMEHGTVILSGGKEIWKYYQNWTIGRLEKHGYLTLDYTGNLFQEGRLQLELEEGSYRLLTSARLPNGNQKASQYLFQLKAGESREIPMHLCSPSVEEMQIHIQLEDFVLETADGRACTAASLLGEKTAVLACLWPGEEPSEHVLHEMLEQKKELKELEETIVFLLPNREAGKNPGIQKVLEEIPEIQVTYGRFEEVIEPLARRLYVDPEQLPLLLLLRPGLCAVYGRSGYHVGSVGVLLKVASL